jgi:large subunit ribosomal protein L25
MEKIKLNVLEREDKTPNQLRREAKLPATLYGPGEPSKSVQIDEREFTRLPSAAYSHVIELDFGSGAPTNAVIRNVQRKAWTNKIMNVELYRVNLNRKITVTVPLKFVGVSPAVTLGAQLIETGLSIEIECLPNDIPDVIEVDLSALKEIDDAIHYGDLKVSDKIEVLNPPEETIAKAIAPRVQSAESEEAAPAAPAAAAPAAPAAEEK